MYLRFSKAIKNVLKNLLQTHSFNYQVVTNRAKGAPSLARKLKEKKVRARKPSDIDDLAGCRVIFYLDSDIDKFVDCIYREFGNKNIKSYKRHYSEEEYNATHVVVSFGEEKLKLSEYAEFRNMSCEVQLTTVLYHAWSEMEHDVLYKPEEELARFSKESFEIIKTEFHAIMKDHIKQASMGFEYIARMLQYTKEGKRVFGSEFLKSLITSHSLNEICESLKHLNDYLKRFGNKMPAGVDIFDFIQGVLVHIKDLKPQPIKTILGELAGAGISDVEKECIETLEILKYENPRKVFSLLLKLQLSMMKEVRDKALKSIERLCKYQLVSQDRISFVIQSEILAELGDWKPKNLCEHVTPVLCVLQQILNADYEGISQEDWNTVTIRAGALPITQKVKQMRGSALNLLEQMYACSESSDQRAVIVKTMFRGSETPMRGVYDNETKEMITSDTHKVFDFCIKIIPDAYHSVVRLIEDKLDFLVERHKNSRMPNLDKSRVQKLRSLIRKKESYQVYKTLVGNDLVGRKGWRKAQQDREQQLKEYIDQVNPKTEKYWREMIAKIAAGYTEDKWGQYNYFRHFLLQLARRKPSFVLGILREGHVILTDAFITPALRGILKSRSKKQGVALIKNWVRNMKNMHACSVAYAYSQVPLATLDQIFKKAVKRRDESALMTIIENASEGYGKNKSALRYIPKAIKALSKLGNTTWIHKLGFSGDKIIAKLPNNEVQHILGALVEVGTIDLESEQLLSHIAKKNPSSVIRFFEKRVRKETKKRNADKKIDWSYQSIPHSFYNLDNVLREKEKEVIQAIIPWFQGDSYHIKHEAGEFLKSLSFSLDGEIGNELKKMIDSGTNRDADTVLVVLRAYGQAAMTSDVTKAFVRKYGKDETYKAELFAILSSTGVVTGEYGLMKAYERKKESIKKWKQDPTLEQFADEFVRRMELSVLNEKKRVDEEIAMRKKGASRQLG